MLGAVQSQLGVLQLGQIFPGGVVEPPVDVLPDLVEVTAGIRTSVTLLAGVRTTVSVDAGICRTVRLRLER